ncbi:MAG: hypothetical protein KME42_04010 [Tildeniella nuda ZEHNDER 1965/U140]|jgi:hypothetical protein|nr:hypothetical protein [Tildeniella nuda ZEHNDER 1965/U140]
MSIEALKKRFDRDRPMTSITIRMPEDVISDLKRVAPLPEFSGYQPFMFSALINGALQSLQRS